MFIIEVTNHSGGKAFVFNNSKDELLIAAPLTPEVKLFFKWDEAFRFLMRWGIPTLAKEYRIVGIGELLDNPEFVSNNPQLRAINEPIYIVVRTDNFDGSKKYLSYDNEQHHYVGNPNRSVAMIFMKKDATYAVQTLRHSDLGGKFSLEEVGIKK